MVSVLKSVNHSVTLSYRRMSIILWTLEGSQLVISDKNEVSYYSRESTECTLSIQVLCSVFLTSS